METGLFQLLSVLGLVGAVYAGIRADLARLGERIEHTAQLATTAHERINNIMDNRSFQNGN